MTASPWCLELCVLRRRKFFCSWFGGDESERLIPGPEEVLLELESGSDARPEIRLTGEVSTGTAITATGSARASESAWALFEGGWPALMLAPERSHPSLSVGGGIVSPLGASAASV